MSKSRLLIPLNLLELALKLNESFVSSIVNLCNIYKKLNSSAVLKIKLFYFLIIPHNAPEFLKMHDHLQLT